MVDFNKLITDPVILAERAAKTAVVSIGGVDRRIDEIPDRSVPHELYQHTRMNSYERREMVPKLDDDCLKREIEHCLKNCRRIDRVSTYDESIIATYMPEILKRFKPS